MNIVHKSMNTVKVASYYFSQSVSVVLTNEKQLNGNIEKLRPKMVPLRPVMVSFQLNEFEQRTLAVTLPSFRIF